MKTIKIAHLYYDIMNLYGENGNVRFLKRKLEEIDIKTEVHFLSIEDEINFSKYDFFYIGSGTDNNKEIVLHNILKYKNDIKKAIKNKKFFLITGNAIDLFGKTIQKTDNTIVDALNIFDYIATNEDFRIIEDQYYSCNLIKEKIIGFQNRSSVITPIKNNLFTVINGTGYEPNNKTEGIHYNNFYGTYLLGPLLVRNPYFTDYLVKEICKYADIKYKTSNKEDLSYKAYHEFINNFYKNQE